MQYLAHDSNVKTRGLPLLISESANKHPQRQMSCNQMVWYLLAVKMVITLAMAVSR